MGFNVTSGFDTFRNQLHLDVADIAEPLEMMPTVWSEQRTGVTYRRVAVAAEKTSDFIVCFANLEALGIVADDWDRLVRFEEEFVFDFVVSAQLLETGALITLVRGGFVATFAARAASKRGDGITLELPRSFRWQ